MQDYYNITSDMPTDVMLSVAAENLETKTNLIVEEQHRLSLIKPLHIWISRWVGWKKKTLNQRKRGIYGKVQCSFPKPFQCSQPGLPLPDPKSDLCWAVPPRFCNQPPPIGPGQEWGGIAATEDGDGGPGTTFAPSGIRFLIYFLPTPFF